MTTHPTNKDIDVLIKGISLAQFEAWMRPLLHYMHYSDGWFWHQYKDDHGHWPSLAMKARGMEMRAEWLKRKE